MLNKFQIGRYYLVESVIHTINSSIKIICMLLCVFMLLIRHTIWLDLILLCGILLLIFCSKVPFSMYAVSIVRLKYFYIGIFLLNILLGVEILSNVQMILKLWIIILYSQILVYTTSLTEMMEGLYVILKPLKIFGLNINQLTFCLSLALSFIPLILEQSECIMKSLLSRGIDYKKCSLKNKVKIITSILLPIFSSTIKRADNLAESLEIRQYNINNNDDYYVIKIFTNIDIIILIVHVILLLIFIMGVIV